MKRISDLQNNIVKMHWNRVWSVSYTHLQLDAVGVVLAHNHPGNSLKASEQDIAITNQLRDALGALAIKVFDHIIVGADRAVSLYQEGIIPADHQFQDGIAMVNLYESEENGYER